MEKMAAWVLIIVILAALSGGCAYWKKIDTTVRCPRCNAIFTIEEEMHMRDLTR